MKLPEDGTLLLVDKPTDWTSFDVVNKLRYTLKVKKIGHAGTLDPLATGLLLIGVGKKYTRQLADLQGLDKSYSGIIEIGKSTPSYDLETSFENETDITGVTQDFVEQIRKKFQGWMDQFPPAHSAIKIKGRRAYSMARNNETVEIESRKICIHQLSFDKVDLPEIHFNVSVSKGTYIRSLAHDIGKELGVGAYLKSLRRETVGTYNVKDAWQLDDLLNAIKEGNEDH
ncbi:MAG: tRNA pseudouridine(55) synthase TruB [Cyclobacteriaceae bacterium]